MTDKEQIKAIIKQYADRGERLLEEAHENDECASTTGYWDGYKDCADGLLRELGDMQEELVSEDLHIAAKEYANSITEKAGYRIQIRRAVVYGAQWQKEQLMAKTVDVEVKVDAGGYPYIPQIELYDYCEDIPLAKEGDKYKVVLIKEG